MKVIVVTGGIGSGKSEACRFLSDEYGWPVYCADEKVKELYRKSPTLLPAIESELGRSFRDNQGHFNPTALACVIFSDSTALEKVESLVFPELADDFAKWKHMHADSDWVILESATILEKPQLKVLADVTVVVDAPVALREQRALLRDGGDVSDVRRRMQAQPLMNDISNEVISAPADYRIINATTLSDFNEKLQNLVQEIR